MHLYEHKMDAPLDNMIMKITKRSGEAVEYDLTKIQTAIKKAFTVTTEVSPDRIETVSFVVAKAVERAIPDSTDTGIDITVEQIQNLVEITLMQHGYVETAKAYILYRKNREMIRNVHKAGDTVLLSQLKTVIASASSDSDDKRSNANVDGDTPMGTMLQIGSAASIAFSNTNVLTEGQSKAHAGGDIHIHDMDFLTLTLTCCQIDIEKLFKNGFSTGHGFLREPAGISSYAALAAIAIQSNQNDQHGGQSIPNFDRAMSHGVRKTYEKEFTKALTSAYEDLTDIYGEDTFIKECIADIQAEHNLRPTLLINEKFLFLLGETISAKKNDTPHKVNREKLQNAISRAYHRAVAATDRATFQAMEGFIHNLNTMHSRAGAQVPFSSINYGTDTSHEARMVIKNLLLTTEEGLGNGETPIFPIQIFRLKDGINCNEGDINYDLFKLALRCSAKRLFPNFSFQDATFNLQYYDANRPETEIAYMGCRTRVMANAFDTDQQISYSRGNLSFTSINMPRLAIEANKDEDLFFKLLDEKMTLVKNQLLDRFEIQAKRKVRNFPFLMGQGVWLGSDKLGPDDEIREIIKHGTLSIGFIGLAETLTALYGMHHGESEMAQKRGLAIITHMRKRCDEFTAEENLNFTLLATPAEGLSGRFTKLDKLRYGEIPGVTDREYYTNSFHVPVHYKTTASHKIDVEAPYHALTNAGHISYIEFDSDPLDNLDVMESIVKYMKERNMGYGAINHPVDRDTLCGYTGIIKDECPGCGRDTSDNKGVDRIRRITGYLAGTLERFNDAKRAEERDRIKHV